MLLFLRKRERQSVSRIMSYVRVIIKEVPLSYSNFPYPISQHFVSKFLLLLAWNDQYCYQAPRAFQLVVCRG